MELFNKKFLNLFSIKNDFPRENQLFFQDPATNIMEGIINLHNDIFFYLIIVFFFVSWALFSILNIFGKPWANGFYWLKTDRVLLYKSEKLNHSTIVEIVWTIIPSCILVLIALPSFLLLFSMDEVIYPDLTLKVTGHQWFWDYEYNFLTTTSKLASVKFDSYMVTDINKEIGDLRLLEVDNSVILPVKKHVRVLVTADDVLHSWAIPSLGIKVDAVPGRLNQVCLYVKRLGSFYGQCSEICGVNHGFMPICVKIVDSTSFNLWLSNLEFSWINYKNIKTFVL